MRPETTEHRAASGGPSQPVRMLLTPKGKRHDHRLEGVSGSSRLGYRGDGLAEENARPPYLAADRDIALKRSMSPSHRGTSSRKPSQNSWLRRASKSGNSTPCCSTHVK